MAQDGVRDEAAATRIAAAVAEERERLRITLASIGDAVISTDAAGAVVFLNAVAEELTGWSQADAAGRPLPEIFNIVQEGSRKPVENPALRALAEGRVMGLANHTILISRDGSERPIDDSAAPMRDAHGKTVGAVLVFRDVSERKRAEETRSRLAAIVESSDDAIISKTLEGVITSWNQGAARILGYAPEEIIGRPITTLIPDDRLGEETEILAKLRAGQRIEHFETVRLTKGGRPIDVSLTISPIRHPDGRIIGASKILHDITARKQAARGLQDTADRLALALEAGRLGDWSWNASNDITSLSPRAAEIFGVPPGEVLTWASLQTLIHPDDREMARQAVERALIEHGRYEAEYRVLRRDGRMVWASAKGHAQYDAAGQPIRMLGVLQDVTERRELEEELRRRAAELAEADRQKDDFIALLAHELRNPLAPVRSGLELMRMGAQDPVMVARVRDVMERQISHMVRLIDDLLDVSRLNRAKLELRRERLTVAQAVSHAVEVVAPALEAAGHKLEVDLPEEEIWLEADLTRLAQILGNLLSNSVKYTPPGGRIWLRARRENGSVAFIVGDSGIGIAAEDLPRIFEMFAQVDGSRERISGGLGIGLALVKGLVELHGGSVVAESAGPGQGSQFTVRLPLAGQRTAGAASKEAGRDVVSGARILIVDDNQDAAAIMAELLELMGAEVHLAADGEAGVAKAESVQPQLVFMDLGLPGMNGLEAVRRIRASSWGQTMKIVALTGWGQEGDRERSRAAGCDGHLVKPVGLPELQAVVRQLLSPG